MKRLLYVISSLSDTGPVKVLHNIIRHLDRNKFEVYVLALSVADENDLASVFKASGAKVRVLDISRRRMFLEHRKVLSKIIREIQPDIVHTQCFRSTIFMQHFASDLNLYTTIHCIFYQDFLFSYGQIIGRIMIWMYVNALKKYDKCIACSQSVERLLSEKYALNFVHVRNGIQVPAVEHVKGSAELARKRAALDVPEDKVIFVCTGVICAGKNQAQILRCLRKIDDICVIFLGNGPDLKKLSKNAPKNAIFLGNVNNVYEYLSIADGFVSASFSEGMPNAVLEALMMGLPCILSNIEPHREIKNAYSEACHLYENNDDEALIACFREVTGRGFTYDVYESISIKSRELFSSSAMSRKYQNIYDELCSGSSLR